MSGSGTPTNADPSWEVQKAIFQRLSTQLADVAVVDNVEASEYEDALPFVLIGDDVLTDEENQVVNEYKVRAFIRCHAEGPSRKAAKALANRVRVAMKDEFDVEGFVNPCVSYHQATQSALVEGVAHVAVVEWVFDLMEDVE